MGDWFLGEIRLMAIDYAPQDGWALCNGASLPIAQNQALYAIIGKTFGGTATTFNLPDLRGRVAVHCQHPVAQPAITINWGETQGNETSTLNAEQIPAHTHSVLALAQAGTTSVSKGNMWAQGANSEKIYGPYPADATAVTMNSSALSTAGGSQPHQNMQPFQVLNYCIATRGIFPPRD